MEASPSIVLTLLVKSHTGQSTSHGLDNSQKCSGR